MARNAYVSIMLNTMNKYTSLGAYLLLHVDKVISNIAQYTFHSHRQLELVCHQNLVPEERKVMTFETAGAFSILLTQRFERLKNLIRFGVGLGF